MPGGRIIFEPWLAEMLDEIADELAAEDRAKAEAAAELPPSDDGNATDAGDVDANG
jgi:hypothetical protein